MNFFPDGLDDITGGDHFGSFISFACSVFNRLVKNH
jgi:hypothetical protein